jgi:hypothetical protein
MIYGWPSSGGVVIRECADLIELKFLGFDPVNPPSTRHEDAGQEDPFCLELRKIGGKLWKSQGRRHCVLSSRWDGSMRQEPSEEELKHIFIGWPEGGGVLIAEYETEQGLPEDIGRLRMVTTMEGRCQLLRNMFSAKFYKEPFMYEGFAFLGPPRSQKKLD